jgi:glycosyltransferase involved in cell wall biosynthesis
MLDGPLRVLYVNHVGLVSGAEKSLLRLLESLDRRLVEPQMAAPDEGPLAAALAELTIPLHALPDGRLRRPRYPWDYVTSFRRFQRFCGALRHVCREVEPDLVHANSLVAAWAAVRVAGRMPAVPRIIWHCRDLQSSPPIMQAVRPKVARVIAISQAVAAQVERDAPRGAPIRVICNGINQRDIHVTRRRSQVRGDWEMGTDTPLIGCMGQLVPWKRHEVLLRALPTVLGASPQARLVLMGSDQFAEHAGYVTSLRTLASELGLEAHVIWAGHVEHPADALAALEVLAHPAEREPFGRVILEALAVGTPVVAVNQAGPAEIIEDGRSGLLVPPNDPQAMGAALARVLQDEELRQTLSDGARIRAAEFSASVSAARVVELYREVLSS